MLQGLTATSLKLNGRLTFIEFLSVINSWYRGFAESLREDILQLASNKEFRVKEISFEDPEDLSPLVADLHVDWYTKLNRPTTRMLVSSFITMEPHWTLRTASIPFWTVFPLQSSFEVTKKYVENSKYGKYYLFLCCKNLTILQVKKCLKCL
jgi:hypothetical protein